MSLQTKKGTDMDTRTMRTFSMLKPEGDELEIENYPTGDIKIRITKRKSDGGYLKHASMIFSADEVAQLLKELDVSQPIK